MRHRKLLKTRTGATTCLAVAISIAVVAQPASAFASRDAARIGSELAKQAKPAEAGASLYAVSGLAPDDVWAVGGSATTLAQHWDGSGWSVTPTPTPKKAVMANLSGVTSVSSRDAWAVGSYTDSESVAHPVVNHWNGRRWASVPSPNPGKGEGTWLTSVSAASGTDVWAVGHYWVRSPHRPWIVWSNPLIEQWDGVRWSTLPVPNPGRHSQGGTVLTGIQAVSLDDVWAVGSYDNGEEIVTLVLHWDGSAWTQVKSVNPAPRPFDSALLGVDATSVDDVWAVGNYDDGQRVQTLTEHWNGRRWSVVPSPSPGPGSAFDGLRAVSATSTGDVWAVGDYAGDDGIDPLIEHWDGRSWSQVSAPQMGLGGYAGVSADSSSDAWAVGIDSGGGVASHWDGTQWS